MKAQIHPTGLEGEIVIPASKSHTIRALLIASLASGESIVANPLDSQDARSCIETCRAFGAAIAEIPGGWNGYERALRVVGVGPRASMPGSANGSAADTKQAGGILASAPTNVIDVGNSGTTEYLAAGIAALGPGWTVFTGDDQIRSRPVENLLAALRDLGAEAFSTRGNGKAPFVVRGPIRGGTTTIECPTSQYLSSLMLALPLAAGDSQILVPLLHEQPYAEMTAKWLEDQGIRFENENWKRLRIPGGQRYKPFQKPVPGDFSSAAFPAAAAAITGSSLLLKNLDMGDSQGDKAIFLYLSAMGCRVDYLKDGRIVAQTGGVSGEEDDECRAAYDVACREGTDSIRIVGPSRSGRPLRGGRFDLNATPDALPAMATVACFAVGRVELVNVPQARLKETDRISVMKMELEKLGARISEQPDGLIIEPQVSAERGVSYTGPALIGTEVDGHHDHRVVMSLAVAGLLAEGKTTVSDAEAASVTYPGFFEMLSALASERNAVQLA